MATTIQVVENIRVGRYIDIGGQRCEVEAISFTPAITEKASHEALLEVMKSELLNLKIIDIDQGGQYYWKESGEHLVPDTEYQD